MSNEQRRSERLPVSVKVAIDLSSDHNFYTGFSFNISEGGIFIATNHIHGIGSEVDFSFTLAPDPTAIKVKGVVRWLRDPTNEFTQEMPAGMGVQFLNLSDADQLRVDAFIKRQRDSIFFDAD